MRHDVELSKVVAAFASGLWASGVGFSSAAAQVDRRPLRARFQSPPMPFAIRSEAGRHVLGQRRVDVGFE